MKAIKTKIKDVLILEPDVFSDNRGWFFESYNKEKLDSLGINIDFIQDNHSYCVKKGTVRGLHVQNFPYTQSKLVRCTRGSILDVVVDLRKDSPTYKSWISVELSAKNKKQIFIPRGLAHGFLSLTANAECQYKVDNYYNKKSERGIRFDDPDIGVDWNYNNPILSIKDQDNPLLKNSEINFGD
ncbi:MAG: dTDP-4-dehydrorhamnose 3,5-epimerase [Candidatus Paceibacterota bacterium]|jgi:dTDP-4-dehydrorhamnose 3,5-epimerase